MILGYTKTVGTPETEYLRLHIRADGNDEKDQNVKYKVKDAVVKYLTPVIAQIKDKKSCEKIFTGL